MKVLVACEESQRVCIAFRERGHEAYSCDIEPCSGGKPEWHIMQDVLPLLNGNCVFETCDGVEHEIYREWEAGRGELGEAGNGVSAKREQTPCNE